MRDLAILKHDNTTGHTRTGRPDPLPETAEEKARGKADRAAAIERRKRLNGWQD